MKACKNLMNMICDFGLHQQANHRKKASINTIALQSAAELLLLKLNCCLQQ